MTERMMLYLMQRLLTIRWRSAVQESDFIDMRLIRKANPVLPGCASRYERV